MAKKLSNIADFVNSSSMSFDEFLKTSLGDYIYGILEKISTRTELYIFSGIIRNYFIKETDIRDIDLVLDTEINLLDFFSKNAIRRNSFGGYKIHIKNIIIDLWYTKDTWAYNYQKTFNFDLSKNIPTTAFFNFSSITYFFNNKKFYFTKHFLRFLRDKKIDVVYKPNQNYDLCIINSCYYSKKYNFKLSKNLINYLNYLKSEKQHNYEEVQLKHFGEIKYTDVEIEKFLDIINEQPTTNIGNLSDSSNIKDNNTKQNILNFKNDEF